MNLHKISASVFGIGFAKGGGTFAAIATCLVWYAAQAGKTPADCFLQQVMVTIAITALGIRNGNIVEKDWGKDSSRVVIDEVSGQCISLLFMPVLSWQTVTAGLVLFRFFDIAKPLGIRRLEVWKGGWGVMMDDVLAGIYANIILQLILYAGWL